ncbi:hypothetical protein SUDANB121_00673 [Nocardiopsis dassonvillei]|uniref:sensor histidine kinase n=1 Tax=Nocardiopsis dassonvillei TaxID=2014 RepID=UPI003F57EE5D
MPSRPGGNGWTGGEPGPAEAAPGGRTETATDAAIAVVTAVALVIAETVFAFDRGMRPEPLSVAILLVGSASIALIGRWPMAASVTVGLCLPLYYVTGSEDTWVAWLMLFVAVVRSAADGRRAAPVAAVAVALGFFALAEITAFDPWRSAAVLAWMAVIVAAAEIIRNRAAYLRAVEQRAAEAERTREEEARRRATEERLHIARELHDVIAHNISLINVQASSAVHRRDPERAFEALEAIKTASKETLRELRTTLGVLRQVDEQDGERAPVPAAGRLPELVRGAREAGLTAVLTVDGAESEEFAGPEPPAPVGAAAYRIVQEALTNVRRHSGADRVEVAVEHGPQAFSVRVADNGPGGAAGAQTEGNGLRGMRERVLALGGEFSAGFRSGGGFQVYARFPVEGR